MYVCKRMMAAAALSAGIAGLARAAELPPGIVADPPAGGVVVAVDGGYMAPYVETIPGTDITFEMTPIPGGEFLLGSPDDEADRSDDEGPQVRVLVEPFWMARCETTWAQYRAFMDMYEGFKQLQQAALNAGDGAGPQWDLVRAHARDGKGLAAEDLDG
ncbi:MAG TPA: SUMF1/EgtB/PvdO family nonheme iron enzyme, partial [Lacipirellulaceae bacterium]|nr:SUMF1/EgtB/PvdO family nonheme iron enzyme [Lacipirellulaceae bacterium]